MVNGKMTNTSSKMTNKSIVNMTDEKTEIEILGSKWTIEYKKESEDVTLIKTDGYCDWTTRSIIIAEAQEDEKNVGNMQKHYKETERHEIIHAFLHESGLAACSPWAKNEEMVDWFAKQWEKISEVIGG